MPGNPQKPSFGEFVAWLRSQSEATSRRAREASPTHFQRSLAAAREARAEVLHAMQSSRAPAAPPRGAHIEVLQLLAAAEPNAAKPPELTTARGFRVTLAYDEGGMPAGAGNSSICVLVHAPPEQVEAVQGKTAYLWSGNDRFELGQFDADGKAIGTLPAGIEISLSDFVDGKVKLEEPPPP
jgi:hypothetical protein